MEKSLEEKLGIKTQGDKIRSLTNEELASRFITVGWDYANDNGFEAIAVLTKKIFFQCDYGDFVERAIQDNLEYLNSKIGG